MAVAVPARSRRQSAPLSLAPGVLVAVNDAARRGTVTHRCRVTGYSGEGLAEVGAAGVRCEGALPKGGAWLVSVRGGSGAWLPGLLSSRGGTLEVMVYAAATPDLRFLEPAELPALAALFPEGSAVEIGEVARLAEFDHLATGPWLADRLVRLATQCTDVYGQRHTPPAELRRQLLKAGVALGAPDAKAGRASAVGGSTDGVGLADFLPVRSHL